MKVLKNNLVSSAISIFFAGSFVLALFWQNIGELSARSLVVPLAAAIFFGIAIAVISAFFLKDSVKSGLFAAFFILLFLSYGQVLSLAGKIHLPFDAADIVFPVWILLIILLFILIKKTRKNLSLLRKFLLLTSAISVLIPTAGIARYEISQKSHQTAASPLTLPQASAAISKNNFPDIYYILPDSYSASSVLQQYFNYDNSPFIQYLENKGFYIASQCTSNYPKTFLSLASTLNMEYLDYLSKYKNSSDQTITTPLIQNNNVLLFLKNLGYSYYQLGSWWDPTHTNPLADQNFILEDRYFENLGEFNRAILESTLANPLITKLFPKITVGDSDQDKRDRILYQFEKLPEVSQLDGPKFVFAHILAPHDPYVFGANCELTSSKQTAGKSNEENYTNQVNCINQKLESTINAILSNSSRPAVILLQADEGAPFLRDEISPTDSWEKASADLLKQKFPIFSAYYLPGVSTSTMYRSITPVNSFREIFNLYFSTNLPLLPDKNYIFPNTKDYYDFRDVTAELKN